MDSNPRKKQFIFNTFSNGTSTTPTKWKTHGMYSAGLDILGFSGMGGQGTGRPDTLQLAMQLSAMQISANTTIPGLIRYIGYNPYGTNTSLWGIEVGSVVSANSVRAYTLSGGGIGQWAYQFGISANNGGGGLKYFNKNLYIGQNGYLGIISADGTSKLNASAFVNIITSNPTTNANPRPMAVFGGKLCIGHDTWLATYDGVTYTDAALTLPLGYVIKSMDVTTTYLVISADNGYNTRIFFWTGGTATYQEMYDLPENKAPTIIVKDGVPYAFGQQIYELHTTEYKVLFPNYVLGNPISFYTGSGALYRNQILFAVGETGSSVSPQDDWGGVWMMGAALGTRITPSGFPIDYPIALGLHYVSPVSSTNQVDYGNVYADNVNGPIVGYNDVLNSVFSIANVGGYPLNSSSSAYWETLPMDMDSGNKKIFHSIKPNFTSNVSVTCDVYYRLDLDVTAGTWASWNFLGTYGINTGLALNQTLPVRQMGRTIQFKFVFKNTVGANLQLIDYQIDYEILDSYR